MSTYADLQSNLDAIQAAIEALSPESPPPLPHPPPGSQRVLTLSDLTWLGTFKSPAYLKATYTAIHPYFALRRVDGVLKCLWLSGNYRNNSSSHRLVQTDYPGYQSVLADSPEASANLRDFGNGFLARCVKTDGTLVPNLEICNICWDEANQCVWVSYHDGYNTVGRADPVVIRGDIDDAAADDVAVTWSGPFRLTGTAPSGTAQANAHQTQTYVVSVPTTYGAQHLGGATIALGGCLSSGVSLSPFNNVLWSPTGTPTAATTPATEGGTLPATCLLGGDPTHQARRPGDYIGSAGNSTPNPTSFTRSELTGYWGVQDYSTAAAWIDWPGVKGVLFVAHHGRGHIWYNNAGQQGGIGHCPHGVNSRYSNTGPESVVPIGKDAGGVDYPPELLSGEDLAYESGPDHELAMYTYDPDTFVPVVGGDTWDVPVQNWGYVIDAFPNIAVCRYVGGDGSRGGNYLNGLIDQPNAAGIGLDATSRLLMLPCHQVRNVAGVIQWGTTYVNVFSVAA